MKNGDPSKGETGTDAPMVVKDKVYRRHLRRRVRRARVGDAPTISKTASSPGAAYSDGPDDRDADRSARRRRRSASRSARTPLKTWQGDQWKIGGGTTWGWYSYDPELNLFYYGTGNPSTWNPKQRPGDNKWSMSIFARDPDTGMAKWVYQMTPHDEWDYDGVNEMILADQNIDGKDRKLLTHFDRNGFGYTLDRATGELLVAKKFDPTVNWATGIDMDKTSPNYGRPTVVEASARPSTTARTSTPRASARRRSAPRTSSRRPTRRRPSCSTCRPTTSAWTTSRSRCRYTAGQPYVGATLSMYPPPGDSNMGNFIAWDAQTGKIVWSDPEQFSVWSGALATAGDVVFYGTLEGYLKAVDAKTGKELYKFKTPSGIIGNVMTYEHDGKQYVGVLSGVGGWAGIGLAAGLTEPQPVSALSAATRRCRTTPRSAAAHRLRSATINKEKPLPPTPPTRKEFFTSLPCGRGRGKGDP